MAHSGGDDSIVGGRLLRPVAGLRLDYHQTDESGVVRSGWGLYVSGDLEVNPWTLRKEMESLAGGDEAESDTSGATVSKLEARTGFSDLEVIHYIIQATPDAFYGAMVGIALEKICQQLKPRARSWTTGPNAPQSRDELMAFVVLRARNFARETYSDLNDFDPLVIIAQSLSETAALEDASAMITFRTADNATIVVHLWFADGATRHTIVRHQED